MQNQTLHPKAAEYLDKLSDIKTWCHDRMIEESTANPQLITFYMHCWDVRFNDMKRDLYHNYYGDTIKTTSVKRQKTANSKKKAKKVSK
tara:strand:- start:1793 stop:2059 length:267 start_codon:yes stop_codon:yes gene_type:complete